jgi:hypothetical protein
MKELSLLSEKNENSKAVTEYNDPTNALVYNKTLI